MSDGHSRNNIVIAEIEREDVAFAETSAMAASAFAMAPRSDYCSGRMAIFPTTHFGTM